MDNPTAEEVDSFHRYFAVRSNNEFWDLSERQLNLVEKQHSLTCAFASLFHWEAVGTAENVQLAKLAVARAYCINESLQSVPYAKEVFEHFDNNGENWVQALTNAILSHALHIAGENTLAVEHYKEAVRLQSTLSDGDRRVFDASFRHMPVLD